jgi:hypothetical protein
MKASRSGVGRFVFGIAGLSLLFAAPLAAAAEEITVEVEVIPVEEPVRDLSVLGLINGDFYAVTADGDIVVVDSRTGQFKARFESGFARRVSQNVALIGDYQWQIFLQGSMDRDRNNHVPGAHDIAGWHHLLFVAQDRIRVWDGASEAGVSQEQKFVPQFIDEYGGGVVSVAGTTNNRIEFWPDSFGGADAFLFLERTILIDNPADEQIVGVAPGLDDGVILAFTEGVALYDADGNFVASLLGPRSQRRIGALDVDRCGSVYAAETGQPDFPPQVLKAVPSYRDPGCFIDSQGVFENAITKMGRSRITVGCNPPYNDRYCPDDHVTRGQMAAFLSRALDYTDTGGGGQFTDTSGHLFETAIDKLATAGVTKGCNPPANTMFCPDELVTRGQMAAFLVRALGYTNDGGGDLFIDDDGHVFESAIDKLATAGVTKGCNPPANTRFCPDDHVTRAQMAAFLKRALG